MPKDYRLPLLMTILKLPPQEARHEIGFGA